MSRSRKHKSKGKSLEQKAFETLNNQVRQFEEAGQTESSKEGYTKSGNQGKPPRLMISLKLKNGKVLAGTCVNFDNPKMPKSKLFFPTGQKRTDGNLKDFCIPSPIDIRVQDGEITLMEDVNDFLKDIHEQAISEFPEWLEKWGCRANEDNPLLNLDEIREEWKYKKGQFGIFRLATQAGFFTDFRPLNADRLEIVEIETIDIP
ncbi:MAG: hypothetical protein LBE13_04470 [Bacteroidales bacterium]|jgi:hypothetical protein|nr:hypothetical protein [Bacteroidales bacterium]